MRAHDVQRWLMTSADARTLCATRALLALACLVTTAEAHSRYIVMFELGWSESFQGSMNVSLMAKPWVANHFQLLTATAVVASFLLSAGVWSRACALLLCSFASQWNRFGYPTEDLWASAVMAPLLWFAVVGGAQGPGVWFMPQSVEAPRWMTGVLGAGLAVVPFTRPAPPPTLAAWHVATGLLVVASLWIGSRHRPGFVLGAPTVMGGWLGLLYVSALSPAPATHAGSRAAVREVLADLGMLPPGVPCTASTAPEAWLRQSARANRRRIPWPAHDAMACIGAVLHPQEDVAGTDVRALAGLRGNLAGAACIVMGTSSPVDVVLEGASVPILSFECDASVGHLVPRNVDDGLSCASARQVAASLIEERGGLRWARAHSGTFDEVSREALGSATEPALRAYLDATCGLSPSLAARRMIRLAGARANRMELGEARELVTLARRLLRPSERRRARLTELLARLDVAYAEAHRSQRSTPLRQGI